MSAPVYRPALAVLLALGLASCGGGGGGGGGSSPDPVADGMGVAPVGVATRFIEGGEITLVSRDDLDQPATQPWQSYAVVNGVFASAQDDLVAEDGNGLTDVFGPYTRSGKLLLLSVPDTPGDPDNFAGATPNQSSGVLTGFTGRNLTAHTVSSSERRYTAFVSTASNLVTGDTNGVADVFLRDTGSFSSTSGTWTSEPRTRRVSVAVDGTQSTTPSFSPVARGQVVAFVTASALVATDTNGTYDVYSRDMSTGNLSLVSRPGPGQAGNGASFDPQMGGHGISFLSWADNLVPGDTNGSLDLFLYNANAGTLSRVPLAGVAEGDKGIMGPDHAGQIEFASRLYSVSSGGRYIAFLSESTNLVAGDGNGRLDAFVHDLARRQTVRVSTNADGSVSGATADGISIITYEGIGYEIDGNYYADVYPEVVFTSDQPFMAAQTPGGVDVYVRAFTNNSVQRVSNQATDSWPIVDVDYLHSRNAPVAGGDVLFSGAAARLSGGTLPGIFRVSPIRSPLP